MIQRNECLLPAANPILRMNNWLICYRQSETSWKEEGKFMREAQSIPRTIITCPPPDSPNRIEAIPYLSPELCFQNWRMKK